MNIRTRLRWIVLLLASLTFASATLLHAQPPAPQATTTVYLPLVRGGSGDRGSPTPLPTPARSGFFALSDWLTYNAATFVDAQGRTHMAFYSSDEGHADAPRNNPAYYTACPAGVNCSNPANWQPLVAMDDQVNEVQVAATSDGRPRLLVRRNGSRGYEYNYWACDSTCQDGQNWGGLLVTEAAGVEVNSARMPQRSFALDSQDRPRFVWSNGWGNRRSHGLYYAFCDAAECLQPDSWQHLQLAVRDSSTTTADYASLVFDGDSPRLVTRINYSGLPVETRYYQCNRECDLRYNWDFSVLPHPDGNQQWASWDLALDTQGRPRVALFASAAIDIAVGGKLFYAWCDSDCTSADYPFQLTQVASGEGQGVDLARGPDGRMHMVYDAGQRGVLGELWCDAGCGEASAWQRRILRTSEQLDQDLSPASPLTCSQQERAWFDATPQATFSANGDLIVAYDATNYARCYTVDPSDPTHRIYSEVKRIWWGVRWEQFARP